MSKLSVIEKAKERLYNPHTDETEAAYWRAYIEGAKDQKSEDETAASIEDKLCEEIEEIVQQKKSNKPRICEILGVEVGEEFEINADGSHNVTYYIDENGVMLMKGEVPHVSSSGVFSAINHPEKIIRKPRFTDNEIAIFRATGAKWVSRDSNPIRCYWDVYFWAKQPTEKNGFFDGDDDINLGHLVASIFPSIRPGDCINVDELLKGYGKEASKCH